MARFAAVGPLDRSLHNTILSPSDITAGERIVPPQQNHIALRYLGDSFWAALLVMFFCMTSLRSAAQTLSPTSLAFGSWPVQTTSTVQTVKLTNTLTTPLTISSITVSGDFAETSTCPIAPNTLGAGATCKVSVTFTPTVLGARTGTLTVNDNGSTSSQTAQLSGTGVSPVGLNPTSLSFGNQTINTTSAAKVITLINYQTVALTISAITTSGDFAQSSSCPLSPNTLPARTSCTISVTFTPTVVGARSGTLTVSDNASNNPQTAQLSGTGILPVTVSPASLGFGNQYVHSTSSAKTLTLQNNQTVPLTITSISASGDFAQTSTCPLSPNTLGAGAKCTISITFTPTVSGNRTGTLTVSDNASNSPQTSSLSGTGILPVTLSPSGLTFGNQVPTTTSTAKTVTLKNAQTSALTISTVSVSGDFAQTSTCPLTPNTLAGGASCTISVTFTPTALGSRTGTLTVTDNASTSPQTVALSGTGSLAGMTSIAVMPTNPSVAIGQQQQLTATGSWPSGLMVNITSFVTWSSSASGVASVSSTGLVQAGTQGVATITASYGSVSGFTTVNVVPPALTSITLIPANPSIPAGAYQQFTATLNYSDGSTKETTNAVSWSSGSPTTATITNSGLAAALTAGSTTITATLGSITGTTTLGVSQPQCVNAPPGLIGWWTGDGNTVDIGGSNSGSLQNGATYGNGEVAQAFTFGGNGASLLVDSPVYSTTTGTLMFWFLPTGSGALTGAYAGGQNRAPGFSIDSQDNLNWEFANLSAQPVGQVSLNQWNHAALTYSVSNSQTAVTVYLNGTQVDDAVTDVNTTWDPQIAFGAYLGAQQPSFIGSMDEIAIFNQALSAQQIQQIYNAFSAGMCKPTLQSIAVNPANPSLAIGVSELFSAAGTYSDTSTHNLTSSVTWSSSNTSVATVSASGFATTVTDGNTTISAALGSVQGSTSLTVTTATLSSITITPANPTIATGTTQQFTATGIFSDGSQQNLTNSVTWTSSDTTVATIGTTGLASGVGAGQITITATSGSVTGSTTLNVTTAVLVSITVNPANPTAVVGGTQAFTATGTFSDSSQQDLTSIATWSSSNTSVATINPPATAMSLGVGSSTITATLNSVVGSTALNVNSPPTLIAISISPANGSLFIGQTQQLYATGTFSDGSQQDVTQSVVWSSTQTAIATISSVGLASALSGGTTTINAASGIVVASATLNVSPVTLVSIAVTPATPSLALGTNQQFTAVGTYADGSTLNLSNSVSWSSTVTSVVTISGTGFASSAGIGQSSITAMAAGINGSAPLTVTAATLVSVAVSPSAATIPMGTTLQFAATGTFSDGTTQDVTTSVQWASSTGSVVAISNVSGTLGLATSVASGLSTISASSGNVSGSVVLTVGGAALTSVTVKPASPSIALGTTQQFSATGICSDGSQQDLTASVTWSSATLAIASVSSTGLGTSLSVGTSSITATLGTVKGSTVLTVTPATVVSITVSPATASVPSGISQPFTAQGTFSDGSTQDLTNSVHWSSSAPTVATVTNTPGSAGISTSIASGSTVISATSGAVAGSGNLTVTTAVLAAIEISPQSPSISITGSEQFTATGLYTDGTSANITTTATWASSSATVATVSNASGSQGLATSAGIGNARISATLGSLTASTTLTVQDQLISLTVAPPSTVIMPGADQQFTATGTYLSGLTADLTSTALWSSSNPIVATITAGGLAMSATSGQTGISASVGSISALSTLVVTAIQHVVIIFQENRTPDNLFQDPVLIANGADIASSGVNSKGQIIPLSQIDLGSVGSNPNNYDLQHSHIDFVEMCDLNTSTGVCAMDGADKVEVLCNAGAPGCPPANPQFMYVNPSDVQPYFQMAEQYTFADRMFQTNQGPSFPAHQFILSGTSAPTATSDLFALDAPYIPNGNVTNEGCIAPPATLITMIDPSGGESTKMYPCFEHATLTDLLDAAGITWRYYTPSAGSLWTAPNAIQHMCGPNVPPPNGTQCIAPEWTSNVIIPTTKNPAPVLTDIANGRLSNVSWVIPGGSASDHAGGNDGSGPSWVASVVNAIGNSSYWSNTAIFITWDDWGGWYDHVAPQIINSYEYGFRVPLIVVSPYAKPAYVSHVTHDFGSILKFVESTFNLPSLGYADALADDFSDCFDFTQTPIPFKMVTAPRNKDYFLNDKRPPTDPDDD